MTYKGLVLTMSDHHYQNKCNWEPQKRAFRALFITVNNPHQLTKILPALVMASACKSNCTQGPSCKYITRWPGPSFHGYSPPVDYSEAFQGHTELADVSSIWEAVIGLMQLVGDCAR